MGLTFIAIAFLACAWGFLLLPDLRSRGRSPGRANSVKSFQDQLSGLDRTRPQGAPGRSSATVRPRAAGGGVRPVAAPRQAPGAPRAAGPRHAGPNVGRPGPRPVSRPPAGLAAMPRSRAQAAQRRVHALAALGGVALVTLLGGLFVSSTLLLVHVLVDAALVAFVALLWSRAQAQRSRRSTAPLRHAEADDFSPLQRRASGS